MDIVILGNVVILGMVFLALGGWLRAFMRCEQHRNNSVRRSARASRKSPRPTVDVSKVAGPGIGESLQWTAIDDLLLTHLLKWASLPQ
jgi:hypothetical protein